MQQERLTYLIEQYSNDTASKEEAAEFARFLRENADPELFSSVVISLMEQYPADRSEISRFDGLAALALQADRVPENDPRQRPAPVRRIPFPGRWWVAASVILALGVGVYFWTAHKKSIPAPAITRSGVDIAPGRDGAVLTLADGSQVVLDSLGNGPVAAQKGAQVLLQNGQLAYAPVGETTGEMVYNTMTTPKGRQFRVVLPDGTKVWLNAASSLRYPTAFTGSARKVAIVGEAYFEVAQNAKQPFFVQLTNQAEVQVLGTSFNINAYENEHSLNTTLLTGSIKIQLLNIKHPTSGIILKPGQQAQLMQPGRPGEVKVVNDVDIDKVMAWRNGLFNFEGATLEEVMRQLERWYDIEVVYETIPPSIRFVGEMGKNLSLKDLLDILKISNVHYRLEEGRRLIVTQ